MVMHKTQFSTLYTGLNVLIIILKQYTCSFYSRRLLLHKLRVILDIKIMMSMISKDLSYEMIAMIISHNDENILNSY